MDQDMKTAEQLVRDEVARGEKSPGRAGWVRNRALTRVGAIRAARLAAESAARRDLIAWAARRDQEEREAAFTLAKAGPAAERPTRVHFAKGVASAVVPAGTVAVSCSESSRLLAIDGGGRVLGAWRCRQSGPSAWAEEIPTEGITPSAWDGPWRSPWRRSMAERVFGVCA